MTRATTLPLLAVACAWLVGAAVARAQAPVGTLEYLGMTTIPTGTTFDGTEVGGLSGITWDPELALYYAISDDPNRRSPSRFYALRIDLSESKPTVEIDSVVRLTDRKGEPFAPFLIDGEGIALTPDRTLLVSSEGNVRRGVPPSIREVGLDGRERHEFHIPSQWLGRENEPWGVRHNQAFESLAIYSDGAAYVVATENALLQDGPETDVGQGSRVRIARFNRRSGRDMAEYVYEVEPVVAAPPAADAFRTNGLVEIVTLDPFTFLALERSFTLGAGNSIRIYLISTEGATDVRGLRHLQDAPDLRPVSKRLLVDLGDLGFAPDNVEGMTLGPELADGRRALVLVSDDNFSPLQTTQFVAFALSTGETPIAAIQGAAHRSPLEGRWIAETTGVVTAIDLEGRRAGFWIQDPQGDGDPRSSEGIFVSAHDPDPPPEIGDRILISGRVIEVERPGQLPITQLEAGHLEILERGSELPEAVRLGTGGRTVPGAVDDDGLAEFQPEADAIDFYESLEGMLVSVDGATVVGPTSRFGTLSIAIPGGDAQRTGRGGLLLGPDDPNTERLVVDGSLIGGLPEVEVGRGVEAPIVGVLDYAFGSYRLVATRSLDLAPRAQEGLDDTTVVDLDRLDVMTFNAFNLDAGDPDDKFRSIADLIASYSPDVVALQEVQDDSGTDDDGTVTAEATLGRLIDAVRAAHGPSYAFAQIDPEDNADGGAPGGNIRVAFLYDPERVRLVTDGSLLSAENPARLFADSPAFREDADTGFEATRKPLAAEFELDGERVVMVNVHLKSKRGDDRIFGPTQPPVPRTEVQRVAQARELAAYVQDLLVQQRDALVIVLGDLNDHEFRPPLRMLTDHSLVNLIERVPQAERYTYNFEGNSQAIDHILISPGLTRCDPRIEILHVNADRPISLQSSDHDPVLASFDVSCSIK